jgi:GTP-binding protein
VLFTNGPSLFDNTYERYLVKAFRDELGFGDVPIKMYLRHKRREDVTPPDAEAPSAPVQTGKQDAPRSPADGVNVPSGGKKTADSPGAEKRKPEPELWTD